MLKICDYYEQGRRLFEDSLGLTESLNTYSNINENQALSLLDTVSLKLNSLSELNENYLNKIKRLDDETVNKIINLQKDCVGFSNKIRSIENENRKINSQLEVLRIQEESLDNDVSRLNRDISNVRDRIREESDKKSHSIVGNIPILGALFTGKPQHLIPGVALLEGVISALNQEEEYHRRRLNSKQEEITSLNGRIRSLSTSIFNKTKEIDILREKLLFSKEQLRLLEGKRNLSGKKLNIVRENKINVGLNLGKFKLIEEEVSDLKFCITNELLEKKQISSLAQKISEARKVFLSIKNYDQEYSSHLKNFDSELERLNQKHLIKIQQLRSQIKF